MKPLLTAMLCLGPGLAGVTQAAPANAVPEACTHDREALLALDEAAFDQDLSNGGAGWRALSAIPGCEPAAADLIAAYRDRHGDSRMLLWHEGQLRADAAQTTRAIALLQQTHREQAEDKAGWNAYVDATVAFLRQDKAALLEARQRLADTQYPEDAGLPPVKDGFIEFEAAPGQPAMRVRWPPNIDVVDGLLACFELPYKDAYGMDCRKPQR